MLPCPHPQCPYRSDTNVPQLDTLGDVPLHVPQGAHGPRKEAPQAWTLPMRFRSYNPWGWIHGEVINVHGKPHAGYDFNDGPTAISDMGRPLYATRPGVVVYAKRTAGWGTLLVLKLDELVDGREVFVRYGHPRDIYVGWGDHVEAGQLIATCGDGYLPERFTPHLHYDIGFVDALWEHTRSRGLGKPDYQWYQQTPETFPLIYLDPRRFHPEVDACFRTRETPTS